MTAPIKLFELKELLQEYIEREKEEFKDAKESAGPNCPGACLALGALDAYRQVLTDIEDLEQEARVEE